MATRKRNKPCSISWFIRPWSGRPYLLYKKPCNADRYRWHSSRGDWGITEFSHQSQVDDAINGTLLMLMYVGYGPEVLHDAG